MPYCSTLPTQMNALTRLIGTYYDDIVESMKLFLSVTNVDMTFIEDTHTWYGKC